MVSRLDSRSSGLGLSPGWGHGACCVLAWARCFTLTVPLATKVGTIEFILMLGQPHPERSRNTSTPHHFMLLKPGCTTNVTESPAHSFNMNINKI